MVCQKYDENYKGDKEDKSALVSVLALSILSAFHELNKDSFYFRRFFFLLCNFVIFISFRTSRKIRKETAPIFCV